MKNMPITVILLLAAAMLAVSPSSAGKAASAVPADLTAGGSKDDYHDWLLGPTGLRGWMFFHAEDQTAASRQILVTAVDKPSRLSKPRKTIPRFAVSHQHFRNRPNKYSHHKTNH